MFKKPATRPVFCAIRPAGRFETAGASPLLLDCRIDSPQGYCAIRIAKETKWSFDHNQAIYGWLQENNEHCVQLTHKHSRSTPLLDAPRVCQKHRRFENSWRKYSMESSYNSGNQAIPDCNAAQAIPGVDIVQRADGQPPGQVDRLRFRGTLPFALRSHWFCSNWPVCAIPRGQQHASYCSPEKFLVVGKSPSIPSPDPSPIIEELLAPKSKVCAVPCPADVILTTWVRSISKSCQPDHRSRRWRTGGRRSRSVRRGG